MSMLAESPCPIPAPPSASMSSVTGAATGAPLAQFVDAVVGVDTHLDTHTLVMLSPVGSVLAATSVSNDQDGFTQAVEWIRATAPGPRVVSGLEGRACQVVCVQDPDLDGSTQ